MAIPQVGGTQAQVPTHHQQDVTKVDATPRMEKAVAQAERNEALLKASQSSAFGISSQPMELLYKAAIDGINERLAADFGPQAIQLAAEQGVDVSPEATADRIVSMSTAFFQAYQQQHPELSAEEQLDSFLNVIGSGIDQGFAEAREILDGLQVLQGEVKENIDSTYDLVQQGLESFREQMTELIQQNLQQSDD